MHSRGLRPRMVSRTARWATTIVAVLALLLGTAVPATAAAAPVAAGVNGPAKMSLSGWSAGNIISDAVFTDRTTMTEAQIQSFFNSKVKTCRGGTDKYGPIICLKDYKTDSVSRSADAYCKGYTGARGESAARIIHRVAQSCGINPQVLIVMLQKEQGLVTHTYPSKWRYDKALGQGCPDDAPCNPAYVGFFHQIYGAARQMQIYMEGRYFTWYKPGNTWKIRYDVEISCGSSPVYVANKATSALYYYTPYQPNAASLRAGYGTGDGCSSYGNRNFYNYFTDWFGSTQKPAVTVDPLRDIKALYTSLGGSTGVLGAVKTNPSCTATTARCTQTYANGIITWTKARGALTVYGPIYKEYLVQGGLGGALGYPKETPRAITDPNGNGVGQQFDSGWIHQSAAGTFASSTRFMTAYSAAGWLRGSLGWPTSRETCTSASCVQDFTGGFIGAATGKPAFATLKATSKSIDALHAAQGGSAGVLGAQAGDRTLVTDPNGHGLAQHYQNGYIHASEAGTFATSATLMTTYSKAGWLRGALGWPVNAEQRITDPNGNGVVQGFQGGWIHSSASGTFSTSSRIMTAYSAAGWLRGALGWPASAEVCTGAVCAQAFAGGLISFSGSSLAASTIGVSAAAITKVHTASGGIKGPLGAATESAGVVASENGSGLTRGFAGGRIHSSASGTFASSATIMTAYSAAGWLRGKLGWPTGAESCAG
ncbi:LGFP repeat-containing protein, partial [Microbacterium esteraromaticum]